MGSRLANAILFCALGVPLTFSGSAAAQDEI